MYNKKSYLSQDGPFKEHAQRFHRSTMGKVALQNTTSYKNITHDNSVK